MGGKDTGWLVTWEFPLRIDSASWKSFESFIQCTSFCNSCTRSESFNIVSWCSTNLRLAKVSKVEHWNFFNSSISLRLLWWASRNSAFCCNNCKSGTTIGTKFPVSDKTADVFSRTFIVKSISNSLTCTVCSSCVCTSPLTIMTIVGLHDFVKLSISAEFKSFLLIMCIDAPGSRKNSLSSGLRMDDAGRPPVFPKMRKMMLFLAPWILAHFCSFHAASWTPLLLPLCLFLRLILKFESVGITLMRIIWTNHSIRWILISNVSVTYDDFREFYTSDRIPYVWTLP